VCLALFVAFWLQLDNPFWAGASASVVCQPQLGASLRKGWFRMVGTAVGAIVIVTLTGCFPQDRIGFLGLLALWCSFCAFAATLLRNFASYSAALAGYTAAIIASNNLGATGGASSDVFLLAVTRASEICIGIACAGVVLAATDLGGAQRRLAESFANLAAEIMGRFGRMLDLEEAQLPDTEADRRDFVRRVIALDPDIDQALAESSHVRPLQSRTATKRRREIRPFLITLAAVTLAGLLGWAMWGVYMEAPWTRNATVRAYVVTMAPEVAGRIVELRVVDNQYVRKGDLLLVIDPTNYRIAVSQSEAAMQQAQANVQNIEAQMTVQQAQINASQAQLQQGQAALVFARQQAERYQTLAKDGWGTVQNAQQFTSQLHQQEAAVQSAQESLNQTLRQAETLKAQRLSAEAGLAQAKAQLNQAEVNLERARILAPVDGYVTNLLAQLGDYVNVGVNTISLVDADSFWVDGYFEETNLAPIRVGDPAQIKLMGHHQIVRGHVDSIARAINVANAQPNSQGVATVNPIFTWVRLAQRIPVRIHIDEVPPNVILSAGMTATVEIQNQGRAPAK
jgi:multidrug resistance efflux pump